LPTGLVVKKGSKMRSMISGDAAAVVGHLDPHVLALVAGAHGDGAACSVGMAWAALTKRFMKTWLSWTAGTPPGAAAVLA
jgi:hypothetical protein